MTNNPIAAKLAEALRDALDALEVHADEDKCDECTKTITRCNEALHEYDDANGREDQPVAQAVPEFTDQVRDGAFVFLDCARNYMAAVAHVFSTKDGKCLAELSPTKDQDCFDAFVRLDSTGKKLTQCCNKLDELVSVGPQPPHSARDK